MSETETRSVHVNFRIEPSLMARWKEAAEATGRTLTATIREAMETEVEYSRQVAALRDRLRPKGQKRRST